MGVRYYKEVVGVTLLTLVVVSAYSFWGAHILN
mgnify:CR=1 FL=1